MKIWLDISGRTLIQSLKKELFITIPPILIQFTVKNREFKHFQG